MMNDQLETKCPRCGESSLRAWNELSEEERLIVRTLPASVDYSPTERAAIHRWCTNCWYEETESESCDA